MKINLKRIWRAVRPYVPAIIEWVKGRVTRPGKVEKKGQSSSR